jgi:hypothetical protein
MKKLIQELIFEDVNIFVNNISFNRKIYYNQLNTGTEEFNYSQS